MALEWAKIRKLDPKLLTTNEKIGKWDYFMAKLKKGPPLIRGPIERVKRQPAEQEVLTPHTEGGSHSRDARMTDRGQ